jgi:uncharacterized phage protein (TIGR02218 family)
VDGTATLKAYESWARHAVVLAVGASGDPDEFPKQVFQLTITESRAVTDWFTGGLVRFESGNNAGAVMEIKSWTEDAGDNELILYLPLANNVAIGDRLVIMPGCDQMRATCKTKFAMTGSVEFASGNLNNFRGEPDLPGLDLLARYPNAR